MGGAHRQALPTAGFHDERRNAVAVVYWSLNSRVGGGRAKENNQIVNEEKKENGDWRGGGGQRSPGATRKKVRGDREPTIEETKGFAAIKPVLTVKKKRGSMPYLGKKETRYRGVQS